MISTDHRYCFIAFPINSEQCLEHPCKQLLVSAPKPAASPAPWTPHGRQQREGVGEDLAKSKEKPKESLKRRGKKYRVFRQEVDKMAGWSNEWKKKGIPTYRRTSGYMENLFTNCHHSQLNPICTGSLGLKILIKPHVCGKNLMFS